MNAQRPLSTRSLVGGLILISLGIVLFVGQYVRWNAWGVIWPFFVIALGVAFFVGMVAGGPKASGLAIPGGIITLLGLSLLFQTVVGDWASMSFFWPLFVFCGIGIGLIVSSWWGDRPEQKREGYTMIVIGLVLFAIFGALFDTVLGVSNVLRGGPAFWAVLLIALGVLMLAGRLIDWRSLLDRLPPRSSHHHFPTAPTGGR